MRGVVRVGDRIIGTCHHGAQCCPHSVTGEFVTGARNIMVNGKPIVRMSDIAITTCPHCGTGKAAEGSSVMAAGRRVHLNHGLVILGGGIGRTITSSTDVLGR